MWLLAAAMCIRFHVTGNGCTLERYGERVDGLTEWLTDSPGGPPKNSSRVPGVQTFPGGGWVGPAVQHLASLPTRGMTRKPALWLQSRRLGDRGGAPCKLAHSFHHPSPDGRWTSGPAGADLAHVF